MSMRRREALRLGGVAVAVGLAGCPGSPAERATVEMTDDLRFAPETVAVARGGTVTWENVGSVDHTVTAYGDEIPDGAAYFASGGFDSERDARTFLREGLVGAGETYAHTFERTGTYGYFCIPHESSGMAGTVRVE